MPEGTSERLEPKPPRKHKLTPQMIAVQWKPGHSGNPEGGARAQREFQAAIRRCSGKGKELLDYLFEQLRDPEAHPLVRFRCAEMLVKYGYGEPRKADDDKQTEPVIDMSKLSNDDLDKLAEIHAKLKGNVHQQQGPIIDAEGKVKNDP